jgi:hypothetical protein
MADFHRVSITDDNFIRGAARLLWAGMTIAFPTSVSDIINLSSFDAMTGWNDLGATKTGITVTHNNTEETFDVDQILGDIDTRPVSYEQSVTTALAEMTLERLQVAWEGGPIATSGSFRTMGVGEPPVYIKRRLAVLFQKANGKLRAHVFRQVTKSPQESALAFNKTGEQQTIPVRFRALADTSISDVYTRTQVIFDQI